MVTSSFHLPKQSHLAVAVFALLPLLSEEEAKKLGLVNNEAKTKIMRLWVFENQQGNNLGEPCKCQAVQLTSPGSVCWHNISASSSVSN